MTTYILPKKYFACVTMARGDECARIFDTEAEREAWLWKWVDGDPDDIALLKEEHGSFEAAWDADEIDVHDTGFTHLMLTEIQQMEI